MKIVEKRQGAFTYYEKTHLAKKEKIYLTGFRARSEWLTKWTVYDKTTPLCIYYTNSACPDLDIVFHIPISVSGPVTLKGRTTKRNGGMHGSIKFTPNKEILNEPM